MKLKVEQYIDKPSTDLLAFANQHDLVLAIRERDPKVLVSSALSRFYAYFEDIKSVHNGVTYYIVGNGPDMESAVRDYVNQICGRTVIHEPFDGRKEIEVPIKMAVDIFD